MSSRDALALVLLILLAVLATAQKPIVTPVPAPRTSPASGQEMYVAYALPVMEGMAGAEVRLPPR